MDDVLALERRLGLAPVVIAAMVPIASAEDIVLTKLEWFRRGGETSERQWWDVVGVLKVRQDADRAYLRRWAVSLGVSDLLERAFADADGGEDE